MLLMPAQEGTAIELLDSMLEIHAPPMEAGRGIGLTKLGFRVEVESLGFRV